ncbi:unannotated protein [freshwater metagenome]|uniref:phosphoribosylglycinamide formyltransferase 1 n=1 Tax=freshwater metagenome TaxID=449393 RepID=A0A6J7H122_9ZZZZ|nr:phosphoribosylglycinamide formyltransferase [Actinomycetota bacterium]
MKVAVLASGRGSNLRALLDMVHGREVEIVAVASDRADAPALEAAQAAGVATMVFPLADHPDRAARDAAIAAWLDERGAELVVLAGYMALLDSSFIGHFPDRIVNVHPSLLPAFPGVRAIEQALDYGVRVTGVTVHLVDAGLDTGPVLLQRAVAVPPGVDAEGLYAVIQPVEHELLPDAVRLLARGAVRRDPANPRALIVDA